MGSSDFLVTSDMRKMSSVSIKDVLQKYAFVPVKFKTKNYYKAGGTGNINWLFV